jgi:hypothetical protein
MKDHVQAAAAAIAIAHDSGRRVSGVYGPNGHVNVEVTLSGDRVQGYDYSNSCHVDGTLPNLYHYGQSAHLELKPKTGGKYDGYDYGASCHFEVTVKGRSADFYSYGGAGWSSYSA